MRPRSAEKWTFFRRGGRSCFFPGKNPCQIVESAFPEGVAYYPPPKAEAEEFPIAYSLYAFPQQLPGPAQPALAGELPQHAVSPGPGKLLFFTPERDETVESIFFTRPLPQARHSTSFPAEETRISLTFPQSRQRKSNKGISVLLRSTCSGDLNRISHAEKMRAHPALRQGSGFEAPCWGTSPLYSLMAFWSVFTASLIQCCF
jgi:hypothetical protein